MSLRSGHAQRRPLRRVKATVAVAAVTAAILVPAVFVPTVAAAAPVCSVPADTVPPQLLNLTMTPTTIDVTKHSAGAKISVEATDTSGAGVPSGVSDVLVVVAGPGSSEHFGSVAELRMHSGTTADGEWQGQVRFPTATPAGVYNLVEADAVDADGNVQTYSADSFGGIAVGFFVPDAARPLAEKLGLFRGQTPTTRPAKSPTDPILQPGWTTSLTIESNPAGGMTGTGKPGKPIANGKLTDFSVTPTTVNSTKGPATFHATAQMTGAKPTFFEALFDKVDQSPEPQFSVLMRRHGSSYKGSSRVPEWNDSGKFHIILAALTEQGGELRHVQAFASDQLEHLGFTHVITLVTRHDRVKPVLGSLSVSPDPIDSTAGRVAVTVTATASDVGSGVRDVETEFFANVTEDGFTFPEPVKNVYLRKQGNHYVGATQVGSCIAGGTWKVAAAVFDKAGNVKGYSPGALEALGAPGKIKVTTAAGDTTPPSISGAATGGGLLAIDFSEGVKNVTTSTLSVYALKPAADRYQSTTPIDAITCYDTSDTVVDCSGGTDPVAYATLAMSGLTPGTKYEVWANLNSVTTQLTDVAGNPLPWQEAASEVTDA